MTKSILLIVFAIVIGLSSMMSVAANRDVMLSTLGDIMIGETINGIGPQISVNGNKHNVTLGNYSVRVMPQNYPPPVNFRLPSIQAGCNGIKIDGGAFSLNLDTDWETVVRNIGQSAGMYALSLAIQAMCNQCMNEIKSIVQKINKYSEMLRNSCQSGKALVNWSKENLVKVADTKKAENEIVQNSGSGEDDKQVNDKTQPEKIQEACVGANPNAPVLNQDCRDRLGNLIWEAYDLAGNGWLLGADNNWRMVVISLLGARTAYLKQDLNAAPPTFDIGYNNYPPVINIEHFISGANNVPLYICDQPNSRAGKCEAMGVQAGDIPSLMEMISPVVDHIAEAMWSGQLNANWRVMQNPPNINFTPERLVNAVGMNIPKILQRAAIGGRPYLDQTAYALKQIIAPKLALAIVTNYALTAEKAVNDLDYEKKAFIPVQSEDLKQRRRDFNLYANRLYQDNK
ncbi:MAG: conjugal transfer protein TraH, partial [Gammaproteobacteria bacterium]|nr:conjugal transfer protein TraH [Gammaproteobacteria bacterium]